mgnify:CR=1 FL=1
MYHRTMWVRHLCLALLAVVAMVFLALTAREVNPQVRRELLVGGGLLMIGFGLIFAVTSSFLLG